MISVELVVAIFDGIIESSIYVVSAVKTIFAISFVPDCFDGREYLDDSLHSVRGIDNVLAFQTLLVQTGGVDVHVVLDQLLGLLDLHVVL